METETHWTTQHRGPYRLFVVRSTGKKLQPLSSKWLKGEVSSDDVEEEALAILNDQRDTVFNVSVWSIRDSQFVWSWKREAQEVAA
jgi:hypothetical protein